MANTLRITALPNGYLRVRVESGGERDLSADVTPNELMALYDKALNDQNRAVHEDPATLDKTPREVPPKKTYT